MSVAFTDEVIKHARRQGLELTRASAQRLVDRWWDRTGGTTLRELRQFLGVERAPEPRIGGKDRVAEMAVARVDKKLHPSSRDEDIL